MKSYRWKKTPRKYKEIGITAEDLLELGYVDLIAQSPQDDPELLNSTDPILKPVGVKLSVDYPKLAVYNVRMIQHLLDRITGLEQQIKDAAH